MLQLGENLFHIGCLNGHYLVLDFLFGFPDEELLGLERFGLDLEEGHARLSRDLESPLLVGLS